MDNGLRRRAKEAKKNKKSELKKSSFDKVLQGV
jgi:hypothetical protein